MNYTWEYASMTDAGQLMDVSLKVQFEVDTIYNFNPNVLAHNIVLGLVNQFYTGASDMIVVVRRDERIIAYTWAHSGETNMWSNETSIGIKMAHMDPALSDREKILLIKDMLELWERFAQLTKSPIIVSSTLRGKQDAFLRLHERAGYMIRGSIAYKRVDLTKERTKLFD